MKAGTDLKPVALPTIPEGYRWVIKSYTQYGDDYIRVILEEKKIVTRGLFTKRQVEEWERVDSTEVDEAMSLLYGSLISQVEEAAKRIVDTHIKKLERAVEREAIIGVYEAKAT